MRTTFYVIFGLAALFLGPLQGFTQFPQQGGGGGFGGGGRGFGGGRWDPNQMFDRMANGKEVLVRSELTNPQSQGMFDRWAARLGVSNGQITREQFTSMMQQRGQGRGGQSPASPGVNPAATGQGNTGGTGDGNNADALNNWAENRFRRLDVNGDGLLNSDEMDDDLKAERDKWDTNKDGFIDLTEFKAYFQARAQQFMADRNAAGIQGWFGGPVNVDGVVSVTPPAEQEETKPVVYRAGNLPKELPGWFGQLDSDHDGQIGLYEWKASGRSIQEFLKMDRNNDGFLTIEEVLYYTGTQSKNGNGTSSGVGRDQTRTSYFAGPGGGGDRGPRRVRDARQ